MEGQNCFAEYFREFVSVVLSADMARIFGREEDVAFYTDFYMDAFVCAVRRWLRQREPMPAMQFSGRLKRCVAGVSETVQAKCAQEALPRN